MEWADIRTVADERLHRVRERAAKDSVEVLHSGAVSLGGAAGLRLTVRYQDTVLQQQMVEDALLFLRTGDRGESTPAYYFTIYLLTPARTYRSDREVFQAVLATVRFTRPRK